MRRTFREYVNGPVAQGRWAVSAGARDGGALFRLACTVQAGATLPAGPGTGTASTTPSGTVGTSVGGTAAGGAMLFAARRRGA
ncbi:HtaA domain-containing protein [Streptomyces violascens]|uniref:HtaA domain-containing protein n=1 Tax=Streptomyces violascens TaxID=67381 RepID=UPI0036B568DC